MELSETFQSLWIQHFFQEFLVEIKIQFLLCVFIYETNIWFSARGEAPAQGIVQVTRALEVKWKRPCVIIGLKTKLPQSIMDEFPVVGLDNPENDVEHWMREDQHGPKFDTGCNVIVTKAKDLDKDLERKFKNLNWIVLDRLPNGEKLQVEKPVYELYPKIVASYCPFAEKPKVSYYDE